MENQRFTSVCSPYYTQYTLIKTFIDPQTLMRLEEVESKDSRGTTIVEARAGYFNALLNLNTFHRNKIETQLTT
jgi:hypothetical protein